MSNMSIDEIKERFLNLEVDGKIKGKDIPNDLINRNLLFAIRELIQSGIIKEAFVPIPGTSYEMDYEIVTQSMEKRKK